MIQFGGGCYIPLMEMTQRLTAHIYSVPVGRYGLRHIFTSTNKNEVGVYTNTRDSVYGNVYKNNVFFQNREYEVSVNIGGDQKDNYFVNNNILGAPMSYQSESMNLSQVQAQYAHYFFDNLSLDPGFVDAEKRGFRLRQDSPMEDILRESHKLHRSLRQIPWGSAASVTCSYG